MSTGDGAGKGLEHSMCWFRGTRKREDGEKRLKCLAMVGLQMLLLPVFLFFLLPLPFFYPQESLRTQPLPCIIKFSMPHLIPNSEAASLPCTGQCEAQQTLADWDSLSAGGAGSVYPGSSPLTLSTSSWMTWLENTFGQCRVFHNLELQAQTDQLELIGKNIES